MSRLKELIKELCPNGIEIKDLEKCCNILDNKRKPVTKSARIAGKYPYYGANGIQDYVFEYIFDGKYVLVGEDGSVINENGNPIVTWAEGKIWVNNHAHIIEEKEGVSLRYLYHYIQTINVTNLIHGNIPKLNQGDFRKLQIAVPPLEVQHEIVHILDDFTLLSAELSAELKARKEQYKYYKDKLLKNNKNKVEIKTLDDVCNISAGGDVPKENFSKEKNEKYNIPIISNGVGKNALYGYTDIVKIDKKAVTIAARGTIGYAEYRDYSYYPIIRLISAVPKNENELNTKFLYYSLQGRKYDVPTTGIPQLTVPTFKKEKISIPEIKIQEKIVEVLDNFKKICSDLKIGLPAEIEARQKQYEFYRDTLLTYVETGEIILQDKTRQDKTSNN